MKRVIKFIDLFSGMGGIRLGFEQAFAKAGFRTKCVFTSEIKESALVAHNRNFPNETIFGDITKIKTNDIPDFDFLLAGFPCQAFSVAGKQRGFADTRGTLFFEVERILKEKKPKGFVLENVEGLVTHDKESSKDPIGRTLSTILQSLSELGYQVSWKVLDAKEFGLAQTRNRIYIIGTVDKRINLENFKVVNSVFGDIQEHGLDIIDDDFTKKLLLNRKPQDLYGKSIKDKRGGDNNIHSWDIGVRGICSDDEKELLNSLLKERRKRHWAGEIGIDWMDGMPLTSKQISTFYSNSHLEEMLNHLVGMGYLTYEHPRKKVVRVDDNGRETSERVPDETKEKGYNIVTGKLSFEFTRILDPNEVTPTIVAMDVNTIGVVDGKGIRNLTLKEGLRLFGYPDEYSLEDFEIDKRKKELGFDLLGNTVCVPVIKAVCEKLADYVKEGK